MSKFDPSAGFDHEKLDVYRLSIAVVALLEPILESGKLNVLRHLDEASTSIALNIAEGNGKRSRLDRARFLDIARGSALESAACLDVLVARGKLVAAGALAPKQALVRIVAMLTKLIDRLLAEN